MQKHNAMLTLLVLLVVSIPVLVMLTVPAIAAEEEIFKVTISPAVLEQIKIAGPDERKKIDASISSGNKFISHHFDGSAYARNDDQETKKWNKDIRPLVNKDDADWYNPGGVFNDLTPILEINGKKAGNVVVCPKATLISVNALDDHFELNYRTKIIGIWKTNSTTLTEGDILIDKTEEFEDVLIGLDRNNKVNKIASKFAVLVSLPKEGVDLFNAYIKHPSLIDIPPQSSMNAEIEKYSQYIKLIKNEEAISCKGAVNFETIKN